MSRPAALRTCLALVLLSLASAQAEDAPTPKSAAAPAAPSANAGPPTWYAQALARGAAGLNVTHFWSKGPWLRAETVVAGHKVVNIVKGDWYYAYDGLTGRGIAVRRDPKAEAMDAPERRPFGREYEILNRQGAELIRQEDLLGRKAGVYRVTDTLGKRELWVTEDELRLPLRVEIYDRKSSGYRTTDYVNWQAAITIPDSFFDPDPSIRLERLELADYIRRNVEQGPQGDVPVLYADLLHVKQEQ